VHCTYYSKLDIQKAEAFDIEGVHPKIENPGKGWMAYCMKGNDYVANFKCKKPIKLIDPTYVWEQKILELIKEEPNDRNIYWYWEPVGCSGKTSFCKYLVVKHEATLLQGKGNDVRNAVLTYCNNNNGAWPELCIFPIPMSYNSNYLNYEALENVKDMMFYSGKYEGGTVVGNGCHLLVFSNHPPDETRMASDRWVVQDIREWS